MILLVSEYENNREKSEWLKWEVWILEISTYEVFVRKKFSNIVDSQKSTNCLMIFQLCFVISVCIHGIRSQTTFQLAEDRCLGFYNLTGYENLKFFVKFGRFPRGKEMDLKCIWECYAKATQIVDSDFNLLDQNLRAIAENSTNEYIKFLGSNVVLQTCRLELKNPPSHCDKAYNFMECYFKVKNEHDSSSRYSCLYLFVGIVCATICLCPMYIYIQCMKSRT